MHSDGHFAKDGNPTASNSRGVHSDGHFAKDGNPTASNSRGVHSDGHFAKDGNPTASNSRGVHSDGHFALRLSDCVVVRVDVPFCTIPTLCTYTMLIIQWPFNFVQLDRRTLGHFHS